MPSSHVVLSDKAIALKTHSGRLTARCVLSMLDRLENDPAYQEGMAEIDDLRDVSDFAIDPDEIGQFADLMMGLSSRRRNCTRKAVVTSSPEIRHAAEEFVRQVEGAQGLEVRVVDTLEEAFIFLAPNQPSDADHNVVPFRKRPRP